MSTLYTDKRSSLSTQKATLEAQKARLEVLAVDDVEAGRQLRATEAQISNLGKQLDDIQKRDWELQAQSDCDNYKCVAFLLTGLTIFFVILFGTDLI